LRKKRGEKGGKRTEKTRNFRGGKRNCPGEQSGPAGQGRGLPAQKKLRHKLKRGRKGDRPKKNLREKRKRAAKAMAETLLPVGGKKEHETRSQPRRKKK